MWPNTSFNVTKFYLLQYITPTRGITQYISIEGILSISAFCILACASQNNYIIRAHAGYIPPQIVRINRTIDILTPVANIKKKIISLYLIKGWAALNTPITMKNSLHNIDYIAHQPNKEKQRWKWNILQVKIQQIRKEEKQFFYICNIEIALRQDAIGNKYNKKNNIC